MFTCSPAIIYIAQLEHALQAAAIYAAERLLCIVQIQCSSIKRVMRSTSGSKLGSKEDRLIK